MDPVTDVITQLWAATGVADDTELLRALRTTGPRIVLPGAFDVTALATGAVAVATLAAAQLLGARRGSDVPAVTVDSRASCAAFAAETLFTPLGWERPRSWDAVAGSYRASDGWIRLHTNYAHHRAAVEQVLGAHDREAVRAAVAVRAAEELETEVVEAGGAAAVMHDRERWLASPPGAASAGAAPTTVTEGPSSGPGVLGAPGQRPFDGVRVLDLTRVVAGPVATRVLAGYGADVLRVDPPRFDEVPSLLPETTLGKRTTRLDLTDSRDRATFEGLVADADVLVCGLRADAMSRLGYDVAALTSLNPDLIHASLDAYGWDGPWRNRRGFDSLVQMSCGICARGAADTGRDEPVPLPVQALDHATGWLLSAAVARALTRRLTSSTSSRIHAALVGTANVLCSLTPPTERPARPHPGGVVLERTTTAWGPARRVPLPGRIEGVVPHWAHRARPLGHDPATWPER